MNRCFTQQLFSPSKNLHFETNVLVKDYIQHLLLEKVNGGFANI